MTIRNFNSIYSSKSTDISQVDNDVNQVFEDQWDNRFEGLTLFNSQVSINKSLFVNARLHAEQLSVNQNAVMKSHANVWGEFDAAGGNNGLITLGTNEVGQVEIRNILYVNGNSTLTGAVSCVSTLGVTGAVTLSDALTVNGGSTLNITGPGKALNVIGNGIDHALYVTGKTTVDGILGVTGVCNLEAVVCNDSLEVTGASTTLRGSLDVTGVSTFNGALECKSILKGPSEFIIDPSPFEDNDGTVIIKGNLTVQGNTTTVNSSNLDIKDVNITLAKESTSPVHSDGAGLTINLGADTTAATLLYESNQDNFLLNKQIRLNADPLNGNDLARKSYVNNGANINDNSIGFNKLKGFKLKVITDSDDIDLTDIDLTVPCVLYVLNKKESLNPTSAMLGGYEFVLYPGFSMHVYDGTVWSSEL
jgi:hypothetical protein